MRVLVGVDLILVFVVLVWCWQVGCYFAASLGALVLLVVVGWV